MPSSLSRRACLGAAAVVAVPSGSACWWLLPSAAQGQLPPGPGELPVTGRLRSATSFALVDHRGVRRTAADFHGRWLFLYFGYSFCPDICPTELASMTEALRRLPARLRPSVASAFVTVDPVRDTPEQLGNYVTLFDPSLIGLTGMQDEIAEVLGRFRVYARKQESATTSDYLMDHSSFLYLIDPTGQLRSIYRGGQSPGELAAGLRRRIDNTDIVEPDA